MNYLLFLAQSPAPELRDIAPPVDVFPYPAWMVITASAILLLLIGLLVWFFVRWWRTRPAAPPPTPREVALSNLEKARDKVQSLDPYSFSILVSDILRQYVSTQYRLRATSQTSPEFLASLAGSATFGEHEKKLLSDFLEKCDLIKFAHITATSDESATLLNQAISFVTGGIQ